MINHGISINIGIIVFAVSIFSSYSIFSGLVTTTSPSSFPWNSALASTTSTDTEDGTQSPRLAPEGTLPDEPEVVEPPPPPPPPPPDDDQTPDVEPPTVADPTPDDGQPPPPTEEQQPLTASFTIDSTNGDTAPATFLFEGDAQGGTEPYTYSWDFGDGQQGNEQFIHHTFEQAGTYDVTLTVTDSAGQTASVTRQVNVLPATTTEPPTTNVTTNQTGGNQSEVSNRISVQIQPPGCTSISDAEHWNKIVFRITSDPTGRIDSSLINTELEVLERVNDGAVLNVKDIVRYSIVTEPGILLPQLTFDEVEQLEIEILDVEYALICFR